MAQERGEFALLPPEMPVSLSLEGAKRSYGVQNLYPEEQHIGLHLFNRSIRECLSGRAVVYAHVAAPMHKKTTIVSEQMASAEHLLKVYGLSQEEINDILFYVQFENTQDITLRLGRIERKPVGTLSQDDYAVCTQDFRRIIQLALERRAGSRYGQFIFVECAMVGRGDHAVGDVIGHKNAFSQFDYAQAVCGYTADRECLAFARLIRDWYEKRGNKIDVLREFGIEVEGDSTNIGGRGGFAMTGYFQDENKYFNELLDAGVTSHLINALIQSHSRQLVLENYAGRAFFLRQCVYPYLFTQGHLKVREEDAFVGHARHGRAILYQNVLDRYNFVLNHCQNLDEINTILRES